jgi:pyrroline-5-carboxylate reductase
MINKNIGIIGFGSMGAMLLEDFADSKIVDRKKLFISTKTKSKLSELTKAGFSVCDANCALVEMCDIIFICTKPLEVYDILSGIKPALTSEKHMVSIAGSVSIANIEKFHNGKVSRILPTIISTVKEGVTLVCHNENIDENDKNEIRMLLRSFSDVEYTPESEFDLVSHLTSCAPGLFAAIFKEYVNIAKRHSELSVEKIRDLVLKTLSGTANYLNAENPDFDLMVQRVATKGGTTEVGVEVLAETLPDVFGRMFTKTLKRQNEREVKVQEQYRQLYHQNAFNV